MIQTYQALTNNLIYLSGREISANAVSLTWKYNNPTGAVSLDLYRSDSPDPNSMRLMLSLPSTAKTYVDRTVEAGKTYYYQLRIKYRDQRNQLSSDVISVSLSGDVAPGPVTPAPTPVPDQGPPTGAGNLFVAPDGRANNPGSLEKPLDIVTALSKNGPARPGNTIWLRGGVHRKPGAVLLGTDEPSLVSTLEGTSSAPITVRQYPGERATIDGGIRIEGAWTIYRDFEITNTSPDHTQRRPMGLNVYGPNTKFINLVIHDCGTGIGFWRTAENSEIYGVILFHNGYETPDDYRGHGHGVYIQNITGRKLIADCITFDNYATGMKAFAEAGDVRNITLEGNFLFNNGSPARPREAYDRIQNLIIGAAVQRSGGIVLDSNVLWHPSNVRGQVGFVGYSSAGNDDIEITGNHIIGNIVIPFGVNKWNKVLFSGNYVRGSKELLGVQMPSGVTFQSYRMDNNTYIVPDERFAFSAHTDTGFNGFATFDRWRSLTGQERGSTLLPAPNGARIIIRPNKYAPGRANIAIYNPELKEMVEIDPSGTLKSGDRFEIRNVQDYFGAPVVKGTWTGQPVKVPMKGTPTGPEFNAFVLETISMSHSPPGPDPTPVPTPTPAPTPTPIPIPTPTPKPNDSPADSTAAIPLDGEEQRLLEMINRFRLESGLGPLGASISLTGASDWHSSDMAANNYTNRVDSMGRNPSGRALAYGYPSASARVVEETIIATGSPSAADVFNHWLNNYQDKVTLQNIAWKNIGIGRARHPATGAWYWNATFGSTWDRTIPLPGEDEEGRIDRNEYVRTRPPSASLSANHRFSGYGDDGKPYSPIHCDLDSSPAVCWHDPPPQGNPSLETISAPGNLIGKFATAYTISPLGVVHGNLGAFDRTGYIMEFQFFPNGTWTMRGYRTAQINLPTESGTWSSTHDASRNEEVVSFRRQNNLPGATIRIHAASDRLTLFAEDGGYFMKNFLRGVPGDANRLDDTQIILLKK
ncbi:MAG: CAP domain-containing protein [Acidobacteriota bacterium]|nr:MAG: CAP domain-containing protein [Acidobacteriota bacterium]